MDAPLDYVPSIDELAARCKAMACLLKDMSDELERHESLKYERVIMRSTEQQVNVSLADLEVVMRELPKTEQGLLQMRKAEQERK